MEDYKKSFEKFKDQNIFIRETAGAPEGSQKAALNRKGNQLFNDGKIEEARRVFMTTGYSDGLSRVGDYYKSKDRPLEALRMYWLAPDKNKAQSLIEQAAYILQGMLDVDETDVDEALDEEQKDDYDL